MFIFVSLSIHCHISEKGNISKTINKNYKKNKNKIKYKNNRSTKNRKHYDKNILHVDTGKKQIYLITK